MPKLKTLETKRWEIQKLQGPKQLFKGKTLQQLWK